MIRSFVRSDRATSVVEFALVAPVLIFLAIGLIEMGRYTYFGILCAHAARAAVQYGSRNLITVDDVAGTQNAAERDAPNLTITVKPQPYCMKNAVTVNCSGAGITYYDSVEVTGSFKSLLNYPGIPNTITLTSTASMRVASQ
jgi:Flp pilus assembly protein TadG